VLPQIATAGRHRVYNVASGVNTTHREIVERLGELTGCTVSVAAGARATRFPLISTDRLRGEFAWTPRPVLTELGDLIASRRAGLHA
jgi:hypothetical protein